MPTPFLPKLDLKVDAVPGYDSRVVNYNRRVFVRLAPGGYH